MEIFLMPNKVPNSNKYITSYQYPQLYKFKFAQNKNLHE